MELGFRVVKSSTKDVHFGLLHFSTFTLKERGGGEREGEREREREREISRQFLDDERCTSDPISLLYILFCLSIWSNNYLRTVSFRRFFHSSMFLVLHFSIFLFSNLHFSCLFPSHFSFPTLLFLCCMSFISLSIYFFHILIIR